MLDSIKDRLPDWARDARINLGIIDAAGGELEPRVAWGTALAAASAARNPTLLAEIRAAAAAHLDETHARAALAAASLMAMNNVYYRFRHFMGQESGYPGLPARLRMQGLANHGVEPRVFELWCLAVSAINGCEMCVQAHEQVVRAKGGTQAQVHDAVRIAAVIQSVAVSLETVATLATAAPPVPAAAPAA